jgi:oligopeptide/dipeptide ABC transporter ATP-binding protein
MSEGMLTPLAGQPPALLEVDNAVKRFARRRGLGGGLGGGGRRETLVAVDHVTLSVARGASIGLVGESGCGKTTLARLILRLDRLDSGDVRLGGQSLGKLSAAGLRAARRRMQLIPQDPGSAIDPRFSVERAVAEPLVAHHIGTAAGRRARVGELLAQVSLDPGSAGRKIHQFSGGQRQRIAIARALALRPELLIADEPTSALDVLVQAQILNLLLELRQDLGLTLLLISHNLGAVRQVCEAVAVMYAGRIVEIAATGTLFAAPRHPYTSMLIESVPRLGPAAPSAGGPAGGPAARPAGEWPAGEWDARAVAAKACPFSPRCPEARPVCTQTPPPLEQSPAGHWTACHFPLRPAPASKNVKKEARSG